MNRFFSGWKGVVLTGAAIGVAAPVLQKLGNPGNMGVCVACFTRDTVGALGLHRAAAVQYLRPEIPALFLGAMIAALLSGEFKVRGGSTPIVRFFLGVFAMIGALVFLGCPWRMILRLAAGDLNAVSGFVGFLAGIFIGTRFFRMGFSLGRSRSVHRAAGWILPAVFIGLLILRFRWPPPEGGGRSGLLWYSAAGPGTLFAPVFWAIGIGILLGFLAQRSRFCTVGAFRDLILFKQMHLLQGIVAMLAAAAVTSAVLGQFHAGFKDQPLAHTMHAWNILGMVLSGLAFTLAGGCPGRQLFMAGEGDSDAGIFVIGMAAGAAFAHNFGLAASGKGVGVNGMIAVGLGLLLCLVVGLTMRENTP